MSRLKKRLYALGAGLIVVVAACGIYLGDYYHTDAAAVEAFAVETVVEQINLADDTLVFAPEGAEVGVIFYPGGKVEYTAYEPLMEVLAAEEIFCALVEMPFNLAVFDVNAADGIREQYPEIEDWYLGGHSLGGSMAAAYLDEHAEDFEGLILLGSYSTADLSDTELRALSIYGSEDGVLNWENYEENRKNLPGEFTEVVIDGGCHAHFGMYGAQEGDGMPRITNTEQILRTAAEIKNWM